VLRDRLSAPDRSDAGLNQLDAEFLAAAGRVRDAVRATR